jgi:hypothetical protein
VLNNVLYRAHVQNTPPVTWERNPQVSAFATTLVLPASRVLYAS